MIVYPQLLKHSAKLSLLNYSQEAVSLIRRMFVRTFGIDARSLAIFRISLALLIIVDLMLRAPDIQVFYTDAGVLPTYLTVTDRWRFSLHALNGDLWWQIALFTVQTLAALGLLLGYRTRIAAVISFVLLISLVNRNPLVQHGGDGLMMAMCFWSMLLPLHLRFSLDAALDKKNQGDPNRYREDSVELVCSAATIGVILQVLYLYVFAGLLKTGDAWRVDFNAAHLAVQAQHYATEFGAYFANFPELMKLTTFYVLFVELFVPFLALVPLLWCRLISLLMFVSLHVGFLLMLHLGTFPFIDFMSLTVLVPAAVWQWMRNTATYNSRSRIKIYYDGGCDLCLKSCLILREFLLPRSVQLIKAQEDATADSLMNEKNTWLVTDAEGNQYTSWCALSFLFGVSPAFRPIGWLFRFVPERYGDLLYGFVAIRRGRMSRFTQRFIPFRDSSIEFPAVVAAISIAALLLITLDNITDLRRFSKYRDNIFNGPTEILNLDQRWSMFAPNPKSISLFFQIEGRLKNGRSVNLYPLTATEPDWEPPGSMYDTYANFRWRGYLESISRGPQKSKWLNEYSRHLCYEWSPRLADAGGQLVSLEIYSVTYRIRQQNRRDRRLLFTSTCHQAQKRE